MSTKIISLSSFWLTYTAISTAVSAFVGQTPVIGIAGSVWRLRISPAACPRGSALPDAAAECLGAWIHACPRQHMFSVLSHQDRQTKACPESMQVWLAFLFWWVAAFLRHPALSQTSLVRSSPQLWAERDLSKRHRGRAKGRSLSQCGLFESWNPAFRRLRQEVINSRPVWVIQWDFVSKINQTQAVCWFNREIATAKPESAQDPQCGRRELTSISVLWLCVHTHTHFKSQYNFKQCLNQSDKFSWPLLRS